MIPGDGLLTFQEYSLGHSTDYLIYFHLTIEEFLLSEDVKLWRDLKATPVQYLHLP